MNTLQPLTIFDAAGMQDKVASLVEPFASVSLAPYDSGAAQPHPTRPKRAKLTIRCLWESKANLERIVDRMNKENPDAEYSLSQIGGSYFDKAMQSDVDMQYHALLKPIIQETIRAELRAFANRFLSMIALMFFKIGQILFFQMRTLWLLLGRDEDKLHEFEEDANTFARVNLLRRNPQDKEVIAQFNEKWQS